MTDSDHRALYRRAIAAGDKAAAEVTPTPMTLVERANPLDDASPVVASYTVADGPCGYTSVTIRPATSGFVRWLRRQGIGSKGYYGGWTFSVLGRSQSAARRDAAGEAVAAVLRDAGLNAHASTRLD